VRKEKKHHKTFWKKVYARGGQDDQVKNGEGLTNPVDKGRGGTKGIQMGRENDT